MQRPCNTTLRSLPPLPTTSAYTGGSRGGQTSIASSLQPSSQQPISQPIPSSLLNPLVPPWMPDQPFPTGCPVQPPPSVTNHAMSIVGLLPYKPHDPCLIISEGGPSWLFISAPLQLQCTKFFTDCLEDPWMDAILNSYNRLETDSVGDFDTLAPLSDTKTLLLLQGS